MRQQNEEKVTYQSFKQTVDNIVNAPYVPEKEQREAMMLYMH